MSKRFSPSCERNQQPILEHLAIHFQDVKQVLEIGSGTGQHAVFFAENLPHLTWQTSDIIDNHPSIKAWREESALANLNEPIELMMGRDAWPDLPTDAVFTANTTHIMQPEEAKQMMGLVADSLPKGGVFCQYGPMKIDGAFTSESNREFDAKITSEGCGGIRDIEQLKTWAKGMQLIEMHTMPANNFLLVWQV
ncbi:DUF938 domain-containing protein [Vibrio rumoiensis]|uniref:Methylase n=1 Tax=Vibrio rumoiensis 1S-45 TaxID=1188252 RepID=A0A1E5E0R1_9VIBR|nr:DUF938 domain-containing protein [Vibrio rumoiensis]OEF23655.1 hypothetical protein A1QC_11130 [Vibrio rumoiensis 1S-45]